MSDDRDIGSDPISLHVLLKASSSSCEYTYLIVLEQNAPAAWRYVQTIPLWSKYLPPRVSFESLISSDEKEIVVSHSTDYGTGISQTNMTIWKLDQNRLRVIFDEPVRVTLAIPLDSKNAGNSDQSEESEFTFESTGASSGAQKSILERQVIRDHQAQITRWWSYSWAPEMYRFEKRPTWH